MANKFHDKILKLAQTPTVSNAEVDIVFREMKKQRVLWKDISSQTFIDKFLKKTTQKDIDNLPLEFNKKFPFPYPLKIYRANSFLFNIISLCIANCIGFMIWRLITIFLGELTEGMSSGAFYYNPAEARWERTYDRTAYFTAILNAFVRYGSQTENLETTLERVEAASVLVDALYKKGARCVDIHRLICPIVVPVEVFFGTRTYSANGILYKKIIENNNAYAKEALMQQLIEKLKANGRN